MRQWNSEKSGDQADKKNLWCISDEKERRVTLVKAKSGEISVPWYEKHE
jgi:hypothetical protein